MEPSAAEDHAGAIVSQIDICLAEALAHDAQVTPASFPTFTRHLDRERIEQVLSATGTATLRRRRLPADRVVWLVLGMALLRDRPVASVVDHLDLALPASGATRTVAPSAVVKARARVGAAPLVRLEMERIADEIGVAPRRISFLAALRYIADEWGWAAITRSPGAIPRHLADMRDKIRRFVLPPRRPERHYPRAVKIKMSNYPRKRPARSRPK
jgi:hypothetical protein